VGSTSRIVIAQAKLIERNKDATFVPSLDLDDIGAVRV
jgi:hypothetical protein